MAVLLVLALAPVASAAPKKPGFHRFAVADGPAVVGANDVALATSAFSVAFYDFGIAPPKETLPGVPPCRQFIASSGTLPSQLDSAGNGQVLWTCDSAGPPLLEDVTSGQVTDTLYLPSVLQNSDGSQPTEASIGRY
jgi:hypothetical protein